MTGGDSDGPINTVFSSTQLFSHLDQGWLDRKKNNKSEGGFKMRGAFPQWK